MCTKFLWRWGAVGASEVIIKTKKLLCENHWSNRPLPIHKYKLFSSFHNCLIFGIMRRGTGLNLRDPVFLRNKNTGIGLDLRSSRTRNHYSSSYTIAFYFTWYVEILSKYFLNEWFHEDTCWLLNFLPTSTHCFYKKITGKRVHCKNIVSLCCIRAYVLKISTAGSAGNLGIYAEMRRLCMSFCMFFC